MTEMSECLFCKIIAGEIPCFKIHEDVETFAFLDINPSAPGHTLVIPKKHAKDIFEIDMQSLQAVSSTVKLMAEKIRGALQADVTVLQNNGRAAGQVIDHFHFHVIPRRAGDRLPLSHIGPRAAPEVLTEIQKRLTAGAATAAAPQYEKRVKDALSDWDRL